MSDFTNMPAPGGQPNLTEQVKTGINLRKYKSWFILGALLALGLGALALLVMSSNDEPEPAEIAEVSPLSDRGQTDQYTADNTLIMPSEEELAPPPAPVREHVIEQEPVIDITKREPDPALAQKDKEIAELKAMLKKLAENQVRQQHSTDDSSEPTRDELLAQSPMLASDDAMSGVMRAASGSGDPYSGMSLDERVSALQNQFGGDGTAQTSAGAASNEFSASLKGVQTAQMKADRYDPYSMSFMIRKGTPIECVLDTKMDSSVPGLVTCSLPRDVYSMNGKVKLLERGSTVSGEYRGSMAMGVDRLFVLWTEIVTPSGVHINLDSPAAGPLGEAGMGGAVDHHWWRRFGSALLFSMIADAVDITMTQLQDNGSNNDITYDNTDDGMDEIIKEAMQQSGQIAPTLIKNQGEMVSIMVGRNLSFEDVYSLEAM